MWSYGLVDDEFDVDDVKLGLLKAMDVLIDGEDGDGGVVYDSDIDGIDVHLCTND